MLLGEDLVLGIVSSDHKAESQKKHQEEDSRQTGDVYHQWTRATPALPQSSVLKRWCLGFLLLWTENILNKTVGVMCYKIVEFPDSEHLVGVPQVL